MQDRIKNQLQVIKGYLKDLYWSAYGKGIQNPRFPENPRSFLFICKGNICRSPFAEHLARKLTVNAATGEKAFYSVGLHVSQSLPPPREAILVAESFGIHLNGHRSRKLSQKMIESFDIVIAMQVWQFQTLRKTFPKYQDKIFLLPLFDSAESTKQRGFSQYNIQDPYGRSTDEFYACFQRIKRCLEELFEFIYKT
jgi:protein-tyrosine phosphatase